MTEPEIEFEWYEFFFNDVSADIEHETHTTTRAMNTDELRSYNKWRRNIFISCILIIISVIAMVFFSRQVAFLADNVVYHKFVYVGNTRYVTKVILEWNILFLAFAFVLLAASIAWLLFSIYYRNRLLTKTTFGFEDEIEQMRQSYSAAVMSRTNWIKAHPIEAQLKQINSQLLEMKKSNERSAAVMALLMMSHNCNCKK